MTAVPNTVSLTTIAANAPILSSDHRTNYTAIQTAINGLIAALEGGSSGQLLTATDTSDVSWAASSSPAGVLLATQQYAPGGGHTYTPNVSSLTALDTTNLTLSFTVPSNGIVDVEVQVFAAAGQELDVGLLNHSGGAQVGYTQDLSGGAYNWEGIAKFRWHLTGLTPGALQLDFAAMDTSSGVKFYVQGVTGPTSAGSIGAGGPFLMQAFTSV